MGVETTAWHTLSAEQAVERLGSNLRGLGRDDAARRLTEHGPNELQSRGTESAWRTLAAQFQNVLIIILLAGTVVSAFLGHTL